MHHSHDTPLPVSHWPQLVSSTHQTRGRRCHRRAQQTQGRCYRRQARRTQGRCRLQAWAAMGVGVGGVKASAGAGPQRRLQHQHGTQHEQAHGRSTTFVQPRGSRSLDDRWAPSHSPKLKAMTCKTTLCSRGKPQAAVVIQSAWMSRPLRCKRKNGMHTSGLPKHCASGGGPASPLTTLTRRRLAAARALVPSQPPGTVPAPHAQG